MTDVFGIFEAHVTPESSDAVNRWLLTNMDDCPLHNHCCSTNVTSKTINTHLVQHGRTSALHSDDRNGMIPLHFLTMNPHAHAPADAILALHQEQIIDTAFREDDRNCSPLYYARKFNVRAFITLVTSVHCVIIETRPSLIGRLVRTEKRRILTC